MMRKVLKWVGMILGGLVGLIVVIVIAVTVISNGRMNKVYNIDVAEIDIPTDAESIARGRQLASSIRDCTECHGDDLSGGVVLDEPEIGLLTASNLTSGEGGIGGLYSDTDWVRSIRHGVDPDGKPLLFMPANDFNIINEGDMAAIIAYIKSLPPVDNIPAEDEISFLVRILFVTGEFPLLSAELIDHSVPLPISVEVEVSADYGEYLATSCTGCHGDGLSGGPIPGLPPDFPIPLNITPDEETGIGTYSEEDFFRVLREGKFPDGSDVDPFMPWETFKNMTDDEISALWLYLQSVEPKEEGNH